MIKKLFIFSGVIIITGLLILILNTVEKRDQQREIKIYENIDKILTSVIDSEKTSLLSLAIAFSKSRSIQDVVLDNNARMGYNVLRTSTSMLKRHTDKQNVYIQIISDNLSIFARSWEEKISDMPLVTGRKASLKKLLHTYDPQTGLDLGLPLGIRASSVIIYNNKAIGILEAITPYDSIVSKMRSYQIEIVPLLYKSYVPLRYIDEHDLVIYNNSYIIANTNISNNLINKLYQLSRKEFEKLLQDDFLDKNSHLYLSYPIISKDNVRLGNFIAVIKKSAFDNFIDRQRSIIQSIYTLDSSRDDIYMYAKRKEKSLFADIQREYIAKLRYSVDQKDIIDFDEIARKKLQRMSKEELIDLILYRYTDKELRGEIR